MIKLNSHFFVQMAIQEAVVEEQSKSREAVRQSVEETKSTMNEYIKQKQEVSCNKAVIWAFDQSHH
jgi:aspartate/methionine/tyrosine aminotransferase